MTRRPWGAHDASGNGGGRVVLSPDAPAPEPHFGDGVDGDITVAAEALTPEARELLARSTWSAADEPGVPHAIGWALDADGVHLFDLRRDDGGVWHGKADRECTVVRVRVEVGRPSDPRGARGCASTLDPIRMIAGDTLHVSGLGDLTS